MDGWEWNVTYFGVILLNFGYDWIEALKIHGFVTVPTLFDGLGIQHDRIFNMCFLPKKMHSNISNQWSCIMDGQWSLATIKNGWSMVNGQ